MKGIVLCGGLGTRLWPLTRVTNKCLLPVYNQPMIYYPIQSLVSSGIKDILIVCGGNAVGDFVRVIGNGEEFGLKNVAYIYQKEAGGIAHALGLAEEWACDGPVCVFLADNILEKPFTKAVKEFDENPAGARIFVTESDHPEWYGVVRLDEQGNVSEIVEKPKEPKSNLIAIGLYMYDSSVWEFIHALKPSKRNELEITDLNSRYLSLGMLKANKIDGYWADSGESIDGYLQTCIIASKFNRSEKISKTTL